MIDYESYMRNGEPEKAQKAQNWSTAIGLQKVDGLLTSGYLNDVAIIILGTDYPQKNRFMHLDYHPQEDDIQTGSANLFVNLPVNLPVKQRAILEELVINPSITYDSLAHRIGCSRETVRVHIKALVNRGLITRVGSDKNDHWQINQPEGEQKPSTYPELS